MKAQPSVSRPVDTVSGYIEHLGGDGTPKCSINDPMNRMRFWTLGAGQRTPVIQIPKEHSLLAWIATKDYLRFVATSTMGSTGKAGPLPRHPKPKPPLADGPVASHDGPLPDRTPKQMTEAVVPAGDSTQEVEPEVAPRRPELSPRELLEGRSPEPEVEPEVQEEEPASEPTLMERLEALDYKSLKALADKYEIEYTGRSAKAIVNAILLYAESLPEGTQLEF